MHETFDWKGKALTQSNATARPRRLPQDAHTNCHSRVVSAGKAPSNSNIGVTTGARSTIHASCHSAKATQKEDTQEFQNMGMFVASRWKETRKESTLFEVLSRLMGAVIVNTSEHVCAAPMAANLVRNLSRFWFSAKFKCAPMRELIELQQNEDEKVNMSVLPHEKGCFLSCKAMNCTRRPDTPKHEDMSVMEFCGKHEVVRKSDKMVDDNDLVTIDNVDHPGFNRQVHRERGTECLPLVCQWAIPDTASFGKSMFEISEPSAMVENHCCAVVTLCKLFRTKTDLTLDGSCHKMFKHHWRRGVPSPIKSFLSNVQIFHNSMRLPAREDPLRATAFPFSSPDSPNEEQEEEEEDDGAFFDGIFDVLSLGTQASFSSGSEPPMSLTSIHRDGGRACGFENLPPLDSCGPRSMGHHLLNPETPPELIVNGMLNTPNPTGKKKGEAAVRDTPSVCQLMHLTFRNTRRRTTGGQPAGGQSSGWERAVNPLMGFKPRAHVG